MIKKHWTECTDREALGRALALLRLSLTWLEALSQDMSNEALQSLLQRIRTFSDMGDTYNWLAKS